MDDPVDVELRKADETPPLFTPPRETRSMLWVPIVVAVVAAIGLGWYFFGGRTTAPPDETAFSEAPVPPATDRPLGVDAPPIEVPPLAETDPLVRRLIGELSSHPRVAAWLATDDLIRSFTVAVENIADGRVPAQALRPLRPTGRFIVVDTATSLRIDPRSYARYDDLAGAVDSVDPAGAAKLYTILKPRIEEAYMELGRDVSFDVTLERAIVSLLRAPALEGNVPLVPTGIVYGYESPSVERLTAAQKQLVRMGPSNVRIIQTKLRQIALALGITADRLG